MKMLRISMALILCLTFAERDDAQVLDNNDKEPHFLIDVSKPYAFLEFDHIGPRKPLKNGEPNLGIWLRLRNNCRLPVAVVAVDAQTATSGRPGEIILADEIVPNAQGREGNASDGISGGIVASRDQEQIVALFRWPNRTESAVRSAEEAARLSGGREGSLRPRGYGSQSGLGSFRLVVIAPGDEIVFSVPSNHVGKTWHLEIPFRLAVPNNGSIRPPYSYLAFHEQDLSREGGKGDTSSGAELRHR